MKQAVGLVLGALARVSSRSALNWVVLVLLIAVLSGAHGAVDSLAPAEEWPDVTVDGGIGALAVGTVGAYGTASVLCLVLEIAWRACRGSREIEFRAGLHGAQEFLRVLAAGVSRIWYVWGQVVLALVGALVLAFGCDVALEMAVEAWASYPPLASVCAIALTIVLFGSLEYCVYGNPRTLLAKAWRESEGKRPPAKEANGANGGTEG